MEDGDGVGDSAVSKANVSGSRQIGGGGGGVPSLSQELLGEVGGCVLQVL